MNKRAKKKMEKKRRAKKCMIAALEWLTHLRRDTDLYMHAIGCIHEKALDGKFSLADIGTSEEELEQLRIKGCIAAAKEWLSSLRAGNKYQYDWIVEHIPDLALKGRFSLADIGTSEEELSSFLAVSV